MEFKDLYKYQRKAIYGYAEIGDDKDLNNLLDRSQELLNSSQKNKSILLEAVTGAGKTVIAGKYIEDMFLMQENICFVWLSIGIGDLHKQSAKSLKNKLSSEITFMDEKDAMNKGVLQHKDVLVINWEKVNNTKGAELVSKSMKAAKESTSLLTVFENTRANDTKIILIIDEYHRNYNSANSKLVIEAIDPEYILGITATPLEEQIPNTRDAREKRKFHIYVDTDKVIDEGIIKKSIKFNKYETDRSASSLRENILNRAIDLRKELSDAYIDANSNVNPLCLIQIPDSEYGTEIQNEVTQILEANGYKGRIAVWLSDEKENKEGIEEINAPVDFLIFKYAISIGWDCPRAQILVKLKDFSNLDEFVTFDLQVMGRILRMPERHFYENHEILNHGYIFTNDPNYKITEKQFLKSFIPEIQVVKNELYKNYIDSLMLPNEKWRTTLLERNDAHLENILIEMLDKYEFKISDRVFRDNISGAVVNYNELGNSIELELAEIWEDTDKDIKNKFDDFMRSLSNKYYSNRSIERILFRYFKAKFPELTYIDLMKIVLTRMEEIRNIFSLINKNDKEENSKNKVEEHLRFFVMDSERSATKVVVIDSYNRCYFDKGFQSIWQTEQKFELYLEKLENVEFWVKNLDSGKNGLSIRYMYNELKEEFYPDYIVKFLDGSIGIYEVKSIDDRDKLTKTPAKISALQEYISKLNTTGSIKYYYALVEVGDEVDTSKFIIANPELMRN